MMEEHRDHSHSETPNHHADPASTSDNPEHSGKDHKPKTHSEHSDGMEQNGDHKDRKSVV